MVPQVAGLISLAPHSVLPCSPFSHSCSSSPTFFGEDVELLTKLMKRKRSSSGLSNHTWRFGHQVRTRAIAAVARGGGGSKPHGTRGLQLNPRSYSALFAVPGDSATAEQSTTREKRASFLRPLQLGTQRGAIIELDVSAFPQAVARIDSLLRSLPRRKITAPPAYGSGI